MNHPTFYNPKRLRTWVLLYAIIGWIWAAPVASAKTPLPTVNSAERWLNHLSGAWKHLDTWSRTETAHALGLLRDRDALTTLQTCALDGGGALMNQSIHTVDALVYLAGPVKSVQATTVCLAHERIEVEDHCVAIIEFENGARGVIEASTCTWSKDGHPARVQLAGTDGSAFLADEAFEIWDFREENPEDAEIKSTLMKGQEAGLGANDPTAINFYQHQRNFEEVVAAINEGRQPSTSATEARKSVEVITAIYESAQNDGKKIFL